jgi:hypothetical protein
MKPRIIIILYKTIEFTLHYYRYFALKVTGKMHFRAFTKSEPIVRPSLKG